MVIRVTMFKSKKSLRRKIRDMIPVIIRCLEDSVEAIAEFFKDIFGCFKSKIF